MSDLLDLIICTECKTRVEYHDDQDGYMSCECWVRSTREEPYPSKWLEIEDQKINECGICRRNISERLVFRCADCGLPFHRECLDHHCKHGNQKQELRSENLFLKQQVANLEEYMIKGVAFRDELQAKLKESESSCAMFKERWELEQIRYEGISSANEELQKENRVLRKVAEAASILMEHAMPKGCPCSACEMLRAALAAAKGGK